jgi:hypothetical protein
MIDRYLKLLLICSFTIVSGCGYLLSPNVIMPEPTERQGNAACKNADSISSEPVTDATATSLSVLSTNQVCAIDYAKSERDEYLRAGNQYSSVPGVLGATLIPIGGAALALGIQGFSGAPLTGLGVGAASILGMGTLLQHKDREAIYNTGASAVDCLLSNMEPYTNISETDLHALYIDLDNLSEARSTLEANFAAYQKLAINSDCTLKGPIGDAQRKAAADLLKAGQLAIKAALAAIQSGSEFYRSAYGSPAIIVHTVYSINDGVTKALIKSEPDVQSLAGTMKGVIPDAADNLAGIQAAKAAGTASKAAAATAVPAGAQVAHENMRMTLKPGETKESKSAARLQQELQLQALSIPSEEDTLRSSISNVNRLVTSVMRIIGSITKPPDNKTCVALTQEAKEVKVLTLKPSGNIKVSAGDKATVSVKGVTTKAMVYPLFAQSPTLNSEVIASMSDNTLEIAAQPKTAEGFYPFVVMDGPTGEPFSVLVVGKPADEFAAADCKKKPAKPKPPKNPHNCCVKQ